MTTTVFTRTTSFLLLWASMLPVFAQQVTQETAKEKALAFFHQSNSKHSQVRGVPYKQPVLSLANNQDELYVFNDKANGGWVVISGDERMPDVLSYSYNGQYDVDNLPNNMKAWMENYAEQVKYLRAHPESRVTRGSAPERDNINPMLTCGFDQNSPYNNKCPVDNGIQCMTGCVATAMAQIMHYYQWPKQTTETVPGYITCGYSYELPDKPITPIDWDNILDNYSSENYNEKQVDAISTLMLLCGMSVGTNYTINGSGAIIEYAAIAYRNYFAYNNIVEHIHRSYYNADAWEEIIYDELKSSRPVLYGGYTEFGEGHAMVIDGYKDGYFHVNWGWGGYETYSLMINLEEWEGNTIGEAVVGIQPASDDFPDWYAVLDDGKMTLYYDKEKSHRSGTILTRKDKSSGYADWWSSYADYSEKITECVIDPSFANIRPKFLLSLFYGLDKMESIYGIENLNTSMAYSMAGMFQGCSSLTSLDVSSLNTSNVMEMPGMFEGCSSLTSLDVSGLNTENVTDMGYMFSGCSSLTSLDVGGLNTENVTSMGYMFSNCSNLTSLDMSGFKTDNVTNMDNMFMGCSGLASLDVSGFKTDNVTIMSGMFSGCSSLISLDVGMFKNDNVTRMDNMFSGCSSLTSLDMSGLKTDNVTTMSLMFAYCSSLSSLDLSGFKTDNVTDMDRMFMGCSSLKDLNVSSFNTDKVTRMGYMFNDCSNLKNLDLSGFTTDNVRDMDWMFYGCSDLTNLDVSGFKTDNVESMYYMFYGCSSLKNLDVSSFNTENVRNMNGMFRDCSNLTSLDVSRFKTNNATSLYSMFEGCSSLMSLDVSGFNTEPETDIGSMFFGCSNVTLLDLGGFRTGKITNLSGMFWGCSCLTTIVVSDNWGIDGLGNGEYMFSGCSHLVGGMGTMYSEDNIESDYAHIDGGPDNPGYLTRKEYVEVSIGSANQVSYCSNKNLDFTHLKELKAYVATGYDKAKGTIWLTRVKQVPAETGFLLIGDPGDYDIPTIDGVSEVYYKNMFKGTLEGTTIQTTEGDYTNYYLSNGTSGVGFYKVTNAEGQKIGANRCYLPILTDIPAEGSEGDAELIKVSAAKQVPYYTSKNIDFTSLDAQGVKAYTATGYNYDTGVIWLTRVKKVPAQTGILVMANEAGDYSVPTTSVQLVYENMFTGSETAQTIYTTETVGDIEYINYYLSNGASGIGFYKVTKEDGVSMGANRSYLQIPNRDSAAGARGMDGNASFSKMVISDNDDDVIGIPVYGEGTTGVISTQFQNADQDVYYNLQGQRVDRPGKGVFIKNGKKVVIK